MNGGKTLNRTVAGVVACALLAGCAADRGKFEVRTIADPANKIRQGGGSIAEAQAMLRLGNAGTALEAFRKIQRTAPSAEALEGIAQSYVAMGRYDLARTNFEAALALAPNSSELLRQLADVFERQGNAEAARITRADAALANLPVEPIELVEPAAQAAAQQRAARLPAKPVVIAEAPGSVTVELPPPASSITVPLPPARPMVRAVDSQRLVAAVNISDALTPRLERVSPGEVVLVTTSAPLWARLEPRLIYDAKLRPALDRSRARAQVLVLNAARTHRLAASARTILKARGWRHIDIGDADRVRARSLVLYPASQSGLGRSLAAQFGALAALSRGDRLVVLLGRDSSGLARSATRG